ncbi:hypothetical protein H0H93_013682 [Arthromyces matolae]|nr:hypothetical protein H0H93_013682 [Arthromyces matolae]
MSLVSFPIPAKFIWSLVFDYDNSANDGEIEYKITVEQGGSYTSKDFSESVASTARRLAEEGHIKVEAGLSFGPVSASISAGHESSKEINEMLENTTGTQSEGTVTKYQKEERTYRIGARSRLCLYQRLFDCPGISVSASASRTTPKPLTAQEIEEDVPIDLTVAPKTFIKDIKVVYTKLESEAPADRVRANDGLSEDIGYDNNRGKRTDPDDDLRSCVWLVPETTTKVSEALTIVDIVLTWQPDPDLLDLADDGGAPGEYKYRYIIPVRQSNQSMHITKLMLYRSADSKEPDLKGYEGRHSRNINQGRDGGWLYLIWDTQRANPI